MRFFIRCASSFIFVENQFFGLRRIMSIMCKACLKLTSESEESQKKTWCTSIVVSSIIHHPSSIIHHPSSIIHHPSSIIHHPSSIIHHHPSSIAHHPSSIIHHPSSSIIIHHHPSSHHTTRNLTWKAFVRATRPTFLCASPSNSRILVTVLSMILKRSY